MRKTFIALITVILLPTMLWAADPLDGRVSLGYRSTNGNTDIQKTNFAFDLFQKKSERLKMQYAGSYNHGESSGKTDVDNKKLSILSEFVQNWKNSYYAKLEFFKNEFAGYESQRIFGMGFLTHLRKGKKYSLKGKVGSEFIKDKYTDSTSKSLKWLSLGLTGERKIGENIKLKSLLDFDCPYNNYDEKYQVDFTIGTIFTVNSKIDLEMKYTTEFHKKPAVAGKEKTDSTFLTSLVYKLI